MTDLTPRFEALEEPCRALADRLTSAGLRGQATRLTEMLPEGSPRNDDHVLLLSSVLVAISEQPDIPVRLRHTAASLSTRYDALPQVIGRRGVAYVMPVDLGPAMGRDDPDRHYWVTWYSDASANDFCSEVRLAELSDAMQWSLTRVEEAVVQPLDSAQHYLATSLNQEAWTPSSPRWWTVYGQMTVDGQETS